MRPNQIFASMSPERATEFFQKLNEESPESFLQCVHAAAATIKARPRFVMKQPFPKRANAVRRALARLAAEPLAEEMLAVYFLHVRNELLCEWLDGLGIEHEEGVLQGDAPPCPPEADLEKQVGTFRGVDDDADRELLLQAFAAQSAIDWPALDALLAAAPAAEGGA